jgi:hypothetical protein
MFIRFSIHEYLLIIIQIDTKLKVKRKTFNPVIQKPVQAALKGTKVLQRLTPDSKIRTVNENHGPVSHLQGTRLDACMDPFRLKNEKSCLSSGCLEHHQ